MRKVLVLGVNEMINSVIIRLLNGMDDYLGVANRSINEMPASLKEHKYDILLIGAGFNEEQENVITERAREAYPDIKILQHYGGGSGLLRAELEQLKNDTKH